MRLRTIRLILKLAMLMALSRLRAAVGLAPPEDEGEG